MQRGNSGPACPVQRLPVWHALRLALLASSLVHITSGCLLGLKSSAQAAACWRRPACRLPVGILVHNPALARAAQAQLAEQYILLTFNPCAAGRTEFSPALSSLHPKPGAPRKPLLPTACGFTHGFQCQQWQLNGRFQSLTFTKYAVGNAMLIYRC